MEYKPGEKVVMFAYKQIVIVTGKSKKFPDYYHIRGWKDHNYFDWVSTSKGIRPLTEEEEEMDFEEWENEQDYQGGIIYCESALDLALITNDREWFFRLLARKKAFETMQLRRNARIENN